MKRLVALILFAIAAVVAAGQITAEGAEVALREAMKTETVEGDLKGAIDRYEAIVRSGNRPVAVKALLRIAGCYEKQGRAEAAKAYERLIRDFKDQTGAVEEARAHLSRLQTPANPAKDANARDAATRLYYARVRRDRQLYSEQELDEQEKLYQFANQHPGSPQAMENLRLIVSKYPKANRTGCALLYLGQHTTGTESEQYLKQAIEHYADSRYGDGVVVGAYARLVLAQNYFFAGRKTEADALLRIVEAEYPGAIDHSGKAWSRSSATRQFQISSRFQRDRELYGAQELDKLEKIYQITNSDAKGPAALESLKTLLAKYPKANRTGCALLNLATATTGADRERYLKQAIESYSDSWFGNGVQVGAYARYVLASEYRRTGRDADAVSLFREIQKDYPDAVTPQGGQLSVWLTQ